MIAQTKGGFDDILFTYNPSSNLSSLIKKKSYNKLTDNPKYQYVDLKSQQIHEFIMFQISGMDEFMKNRKSVFE